MKCLASPNIFFLLWVACFALDGVPSKMVLPSMGKKRIIRQHLDNKLQGVSLQLCPIVVILAKEVVGTKSFRQFTRNAVVDICTRLRIETASVCSGIAASFETEFFEVLQRGILARKRICDGPFYIYKNWTIRIPPKPENLSVSKLEWAASSDKYKIAHVSDIHLDLNYDIDGPATCREPLCCHKHSTPDGQGSKASKPLGEHKCDTSPALFSSFLRFLSGVEADVVYYTGDSVDHHDWIQSEEHDKLAIVDVFEQLQKIHPKRVFSALGNHESFPVDSFPSKASMDAGSNQWLYDLFATLNTGTLDEEAIKTTRRAGFYTTVVRKGLRLIALNTNFCETKNFWMIIDNVDPFGQLEWAAQVLLEAEKVGEKVHIIGHHPPGACNKYWALNFARLLSRFKDTVSGVFTGHQHTTDFELSFKNSHSAEPEHVIYVGPSVVPYSDVNPAFSVYELNAGENSSHVVTDFTTYSIDIDADTPEWRSVVHAKESYGMLTLSPTSYYQLVTKMYTNDTLFKLFNENRYRLPPPEPVDKKKVLCSLLTTVPGQEEHCL